MGCVLDSCRHDRVGVDSVGRSTGFNGSNSMMDHSLMDVHCLNQLLDAESVPVSIAETLQAVNVHEVDQTHFEVFDELTKYRTGSRVFVARSRIDHSWWALRVADKAKVFPHMIRGLLHERKLLIGLERTSPFFVSLGFAFQDEHQLYILSEYCHGGSFRSYLNIHKRMTPELVKFYAAELIASLLTLHGVHHVVHRFITPGSLFFDAEGHLKLASFSRSERLVAERNFSTRGKVGCRGYTAPEIIIGDIVISGIDYTFDVDTWSLGVTVYELLHGKRPLTHDREEFISSDFVLEIDDDLPEPAKEFLRGTVCFDRLDRLRMSALRRLAWFGDFNWDDIRHRRLQAPLTPRINRFSRRQQIAWPSRVDTEKHKPISEAEQSQLLGWHFSATSHRKFGQESRRRTSSGVPLQYAKSGSTIRRIQSDLSPRLKVPQFATIREYTVLSEHADESQKQGQSCAQPAINVRAPFSRQLRA